MHTGIGVIRHKTALTHADFNKSICRLLGALVLVVAAAVAFGACVAFDSAHSRVQHGTFVVFIWSDKRFIVAADSRVKWIRESKEPDDSVCKISSIDGHYVFTQSGATGYEAFGEDASLAWRNEEEARAIFHKHVGEHSEAQILVSEVADEWAAYVVKKWSALLNKRPELVRQAASANKDVISNGIFAAAANNKVAIALRSIVLKGDQIFATPDSCVAGLFVLEGSLQSRRNFS